jgi:hypothetical protein
MSLDRAAVGRLPGVRVVIRIGPTRLLRVLALVYVVGFAAFVTLKDPPRPLTIGRDPMTYLAAGERLNAGHPLYALAPGDRPVILQPPYWDVPLLSPPPIAVAWRPLALLGEAGAALWWIGGVVATWGVVAWILWRGAPWTLVSVVVLTPAITMTAWSGNADAYLFPLLFATWFVRDRPGLAGPAIAVASVVKVTPVITLAWLLTTRRYQALIAAILAIGALILLGGLGAGFGSYPAWLDGASGAAGTPLSIATVTGAPTWLVAAIAGAVAIVGGRLVRHDGRAFAIAIVASVAATPTLYFAPLALLAAALAPGVAPLLRPQAALPTRADPDAAAG